MDTFNQNDRTISEETKMEVSPSHHCHLHHITEDGMSDKMNNTNDMFPSLAHKTLQPKHFFFTLEKVVKVTAPTTFSPTHEEIAQEYRELSKAECEHWLESIRNNNFNDYRTFDGYQRLLADLEEFKEKFINAPHGLMNKHILKDYEPMFQTLGEAIKDIAKQIDARERECYTALMNWCTIRKNTIQEVQAIINTIQEKEKIYRIGQIGYSSVGLLSTGVGIAGMAAAPFTFGTSLGLTFGAVLTGVASGTTGLIHSAFKDKKTKEMYEKVVTLLEKDKKSFELLQKHISELEKLTNREMEFRDVSLPGAHLLNAGHVDTGTRNIVNTAAAFGKTAGRVIPPIAVLMSIVDIASIAFFSFKIYTNDPNEWSAALKEQYKMLKEELMDVKALVRQRLPRFFLDCEEDISVYNSSDPEGDETENNNNNDPEIENKIQISAH